MQDEIDSLHDNRTEALVPRQLDMNLVSSKWVFKVKTRADGSIERYKAQLVAMVSHNSMAWALMKHLV